MHTYTFKIYVRPIPYRLGKAQMETKNLEELYVMEVKRQLERTKPKKRFKRSVFVDIAFKTSEYQKGSKSLTESKSERPVPITTYPNSNLCAPVLQAMIGTLINDDLQIQKLSSRKILGESNEIQIEIQEFTAWEMILDTLRIRKKK